MSAHIQKLKESLATINPDITSFEVTIIEVCLDDHPPSSERWHYNEESTAAPATFTKLKCDEMTKRTGAFDLLFPVRDTASRKFVRHEGGLPPYFWKDGVVKRKFECTLVLKEKQSKKQAKP